MKKRAGFLCAAFAVVSSSPAFGQLQQADLGSCDLELGGVIEDYHLVYRTFGRLNAARDNSILIPTWFTGTAAAWEPMLGPAGVVDTTDIFVVVVESLGAGRSSSPSNSRKHPQLSFPEITVGDMVETSYRLLQEHLELPELYAVVGISLGGFQAFEWAVSHPEYVERIVPIVGTPVQAPYQRAFWDLMGGVAQQRAEEPQPTDATADVLARLLVIGLTSPAGANTISFSDHMTAQLEAVRSADMFEWAWQARAINRHDVSRRFGGDMTRAAARWSGPALIVVAATDHSVSPGPAQRFADLIDAETYVIESPSGHVAVFSDPEAQAMVREFLRR